MVMKIALTDRMKEIVLNIIVKKDSSSAPMENVL